MDALHHELAPRNPAGTIASLMMVAQNKTSAPNERTTAAKTVAIKLARYIEAEKLRMGILPTIAPVLKIEKTILARSVDKPKVHTDTRNALKLIAEYLKKTNSDSFLIPKVWEHLRDAGRYAGSRGEDAFSQTILYPTYQSNGIAKPNTLYKYFEPVSKRAKRTKKIEYQFSQIGKEILLTM